MHQQRLDAVLDAIAGTNAQSVLDLGCGDGDLFLLLAARQEITQIVGIDICAVSLARLKTRLAQINAAAKKIHLQIGSMTVADPALSGFGCAVLLETIEHIAPCDLPQLERAVFQQMRPRNVIITTPNAEFNPLLGVPTHRFRHPDHQFEWPRAKFRHWGNRVAVAFDYVVQYRDIAGCHPVLGGASQMAIFNDTREMGN